MIIIGFPGIGKSTLASNNDKFVDLESSYFKTPGLIEKSPYYSLILSDDDFVKIFKDDDWVVDYCKLADILSENGRIVFVSSHKAVRDYLAKAHTSEPIVCIFPSERIKEQWVKKLEDRYMNTGLDKDYRAFIRARDHYDDDVRELYSDDGMPCKWVITDINYDLEEEIDKLFDCIRYSSKRDVEDSR